MAKSSGPKNRKGGNEKVPQAPAGREKFLDRMGRYSLYGQMLGSDNPNMTMGQRTAGALYSIGEQATLGQMGALGKAISGGISARGRKQGGTAGGSGIDTQTIPFQQIKGDNVVAAVNQSTRQVVGGVNTVNNTLGKGFNSLTDRLQAQGQALDSIVGANEDVAIQMRELYEQLNKMAYARGGAGGAGGAGPAGMQTGASPFMGGGGSSLLQNILTGGIASLLGAGAESLLDKFRDKKDAKNVDEEKNKKKKTTQPRDERGRFKPAEKPGFRFPKSTGLLSQLGKSFMGALEKGATPVFAAIAIWDAWEKIDNLDPSMDLETYRKEVAKIIGKAGAEFGLMWVGAVIGGIVAGAISGPGAIVGFAGGLLGGALAEYALGDKIDPIVDFVVENLYVGESTPSKVKNKTKAEAILTPNKSQVNSSPVSPSTGAGRPSFLSPNNKSGVQFSSELSEGEIDQLFKLAPIGTPDSELLSLAERMFPGRKLNKLKERMKLLHQLMQPQSSLSRGVQVASLDNSSGQYLANNFGLQSPGTSESKLRSQEAQREEQARRNISNDITINGRELLYKADKITFDTDVLEFKFNEKKETLAGASSATPGGAGGGGGGGGGGGFSSPVSGTVGQVLETIKKRESGGNYQARNKSSSASGAYQFIDSTWQSLTKKYGVGTQYKSAGDAPPEVQDAVAKAYVEDILKENNGDVSKVPLVWYTGNAQGKMSQKALAANNGLTPEAYQGKWMSDFNKIAGSAGGGGLQAPDAGSVTGGGLQAPAAAPDASSVSSGPTGGGGLQAPEAVGGEQGQQSGSQGTAKVIEAYGGHRPGRPEQRIINLAQQAATKAGMPSVTLTSGKGNWISPSGRAKGQKTTMHSTGLAVDIGASSFRTPQQKHAFISAAKAGGAGGVGVYKDGSVHIDFGKNRSWNWGDPDQAGFQNALKGGGGSSGAAESPIDATPVSGSGGGGGAGLGGGGGMGSPMGSMMGGGGNPIGSMMGMLGGGGSPFGIVGNLMGSVLGGLSNRTSLASAAPKKSASTVNVVNNNEGRSKQFRDNNINPNKPLPAIDNMFARLFDGSSMFG